MNIYKKLLLFLGLVVMISMNTYAQNNENDTPVRGRRQVLKPYVFALGPKMDFNYTLAADPKGMSIDMSGNPGFNVGVVANLRFGRPLGRPLGTERFGVQLEAMYSMRNLKNNVKNMTINAIEIPLLFQWFFIPELAIEIGPTFTSSFSVSPKYLEIPGISYETGKIKAGDIMLTLGLNCKLRNGFMAEFRYNHGNSNLAADFKTKVSTISIGVGWLFTIIK